MGRQSGRFRSWKRWSTVLTKIRKVKRAVCSVRRNSKRMKKLILEIRRLGGNSGKRRNYG